MSTEKESQFTPVILLDYEAIEKTQWFGDDYGAPIFKKLEEFKNQGAKIYATSDKYTCAKLADQRPIQKNRALFVGNLGYDWLYARGSKAKENYWPFIRKKFGESTLLLFIDCDAQAYTKAVKTGIKSLYAPSVSLLGPEGLATYMQEGFEELKLALT